MLYLVPMYTEAGIINWVLLVKDYFLNPYMIQRGKEEIRRGWIRPSLDAIVDRVYEIDPRCLVRLTEEDCSGYFSVDDREMGLHRRHIQYGGRTWILKTPLHEIAHLYQAQEGLIPDTVSNVREVLVFEQPAEVWSLWVYLSLIEQQGIRDGTGYPAPSYFNKRDIAWVAKRYGWK